MQGRATRAADLGAGALVGVLAGAVAVAVGHLASGLTAPTDSPVLAVGGAVVDATPQWLEDLAIRWFGTADKTVLLAVITLVLVLASAGLGVLARRHPRSAVLGVLLLGAVSAAAAMTRPGSGPLSAVPSLAGAAAGAVALVTATRRTWPDDPRPGDRTPPGTDRSVLSRRGLLSGALVMAGVAVLAGGAGALLGRGRAQVEALRAALRLPAPADPAAPLPASVSSGVAGTVPFTVPNKDFYRVDTNLVVPSIDPDEWRLAIVGRVRNPLTLTYADLLALPLVERDVTLTCVSNEVGGQYVGNARWLGVRLTDVLDRAGLDPAADQLLCTSVDGWTSSTPVAVATDGRDAMLAVGMNGEPLPLEHGFPVRMIVPGLYGFVSATKWLVSIEATTYAAAQAYWTQRGWATDGTIRTMSRIEVPAARSTVPAGRTPVAGTAWAQHRGIEAVEVQVDDGPWRAATLAAVPSTDTWRQWSYAWDATPGQHTLRVRATDDTGAVQPAAPLDPFPSGAQGWHEVAVTVG